MCRRAITIRASTEDGRVATAATDLMPTRDAVPVGAEQAWPVPDALLGGLDVAWQALGATIVSPTFSEDSERSLHDGLALDGSRIRRFHRGRTRDLHGRPGHR